MPERFKIPRRLERPIEQTFRKLSDYLLDRIAELQQSIDDVSAVGGDVTAHLADTTDAHDASAISYAGGTGMSATNVETGLDELANEKLSLSGGTMTGDLRLTADGNTRLGHETDSGVGWSFSSASAMQFDGALGAYLYCTDAGYWGFGGGSGVTEMDMGGMRLAYVDDPTAAQDAATKNYVDDEIDDHEGEADPHPGYLLASDYEAIPDDGVGPAQVTGLVLHASFDSITAVWDPNTEVDMVDGYGWYQIRVDDTSVAFGSIIFDLRAHGTAIIIPNLNFGQQYWVEVRAIDAHGNQGAVWTVDDITTIAIDPEVIDVWALDAAQYIEGSGFDGSNSQDLTATTGWRLDAAGIQALDAILRGTLRTNDVAGAFVEVDGDSVEFTPTDITGAELPGSITNEDDHLLVMKPSDLVTDQSEIVLAGESSSAYSGSAFHVKAKRHRLSKDAGGTQGLFTFPSTRGGAMLRTDTFATSAAWTTCPVTAGGVVLPTAVGATWDTTNDYWQAPTAWFEDATSGITVNVWAFCEIEANATGFRGIRVQKYSISGGTSIATYTLGTDVATAAAEYRDGGSVGLELTGTNQAIRLQMFQNSGGNRAVAYHWGVEYTGFY